MGRHCAARLHAHTPLDELRGEQTVRVEVHVYDLSNGLARAVSQSVVGAAIFLLAFTTNSARCHPRPVPLHRHPAGHRAAH